MQDVPSDVTQAVQVEMPNGQRVMLIISLPSGTTGRIKVQVLDQHGRLWKAHPPSQEEMTHWLAVNLPASEDRLLTRAAVSAMTGLSVARLKELEKVDPTYPRKLTFKGTRRVGFWLSEVRAWLKDHVGSEADADPAHPPARRQRRTRGQHSG